MLFLANPKLLPLQTALWIEAFHALVPGSVHGKLLKTLEQTCRTARGLTGTDRPPPHPPTNNSNLSHLATKVRNSARCHLLTILRDQGPCPSSSAGSLSTQHSVSHQPWAPRRPSPLLHIPMSCPVHPLSSSQTDSSTGNSQGSGVQATEREVEQLRPKGKFHGRLPEFKNWTGS